MKARENACKSSLYDHNWFCSFIASKETSMRQFGAYRKRLMQSQSIHIEICALVSNLLFLDSQTTSMRLTKVSSLTERGHVS